MLIKMIFITYIFVLSWLTIVIISQAIREIIKDLTTKNILEINGDDLEGMMKLVDKLPKGLK